MRSFTKLGSALFFASALSVGTVAAQEATPSREIAGLIGPAQPQGFGVETFFSIDLGPEFPTLADADALTMRARFVTLQPGGVVPVHSHEGRPATTYVLTGEAVEHRSDVDRPVVRRAGDVTRDAGGVAQWWENTSDQVVTMFVVDVVAPGSPTDG